METHFLVLFTRRKKTPYVSEFSYFSPQSLLSHNDFSPSNAPTVELEFAGTINKNALYKDQKIGLVYAVPNGFGTTWPTLWNVVSYYVQIGDGTTPASELPPAPLISPIEGHHYTTTYDGKIFVAIDGALRHVQTMDTYRGLFVKNPIMSNRIYDSEGLSRYKIGEVLGSYTNILRDVNTGMVYFMENGTLRHITSPAVANRYQFKLQNVSNINGTGGYTIGNPFY